MPTSTDLVTDLPADFEIFGQAVATSMADLLGGTTGQVLAKASNTNMDFSWVAIDPLVILDAKGDLITATAADTPARLAVGTNGQILTADSTAATGIKWATPAGGGKVLQVVSATTTTSTAIATTTLTDTTVTATITPSSATSKILVIVSGSVFANRPSSTDVWAEARLLRAATTLMDWANFDFIGVNMPSSGSTQIAHQISMNYLDAPSSTSALTYKVQGAHGNAGTITWQVNSTPSTITLMEIGA